MHCSATITVKLYSVVYVWYSTYTELIALITLQFLSHPRKFINCFAFQTSLLFITKSFGKLNTSRNRMGWEGK